MATMLYKLIFIIRIMNNNKYTESLTRSVSQHKRILSTFPPKSSQFLQRNLNQTAKRFSKRIQHKYSSSYTHYKKKQIIKQEICTDFRTKLKLNLINQFKVLRLPQTQYEKQSKLFTQKCLQLMQKKHHDRYQLKQSLLKFITSNKHSQKQILNNNIRQHNYKSQSYLKHKQKIPQQQQQQSLIQDQNVMHYDSTGGGINIDSMYPYNSIKQQQLEDTALPRAQSTQLKRKNFTWRSVPDVTGIRINDQIKKWNIQFTPGVQCLTLKLKRFQPLKKSNFNLTFKSQRVSTTKSARINFKDQSSKNVKIFRKIDEFDTGYMKRIKAYLNFIFKINFSNKIYVSLNLLQNTDAISQCNNKQYKNNTGQNFQKYKVYIQKGNNSLLVKSLIKRRFWLEIVDSKNDPNLSFCWTQNKCEEIHNRQSKVRIGYGPQLSNFEETFEKKSIKQKIPQKQKEKFQMNNKILVQEDCFKVQQFITNKGFKIPFETVYKTKLITNHLPNNSSIGSKKRLFKSLFQYYTYIGKNPFDYIPLSYHVTGIDDNQYRKFMHENQNNPDKIWIVKPGQHTNQGKGIKLAQTQNVRKLIDNKIKHQNGKNLTYIIQDYIHKPFLYNGRKFDIRHYLLLTSVNGALKGYWYKEGYIRTSSQLYDCSDLDNIFVHLTNDFVQRKSEDYEKYELGNKLSYQQFQRYLDHNIPNKNYNFQLQIVQKMKEIILDAIKANSFSIDYQRRQNNFEIFGFDFMIDKNFKPWLIQINFNPCLEVNCPLLNRIIPSMVESSLRIGLDALLPPKIHYPVSKRYNLSENYLKNLRYELIFDELKIKNKVIQICEAFKQQDEQSQEQQYCDDGKEVQDLQL